MSDNVFQDRFSPPLFLRKPIDPAGKYHEYVIPGLTRNPAPDQRTACFERPGCRLPAVWRLHIPLSPDQQRNSGKETPYGFTRI